MTQAIFLEILPFLFGAFILGWFARWAWEQFMFDDFDYFMDEMDHTEDTFHTQAPAQPMAKAMEPVMQAAPVAAPVAAAVVAPVVAQTMPSPQKNTDLKVVEGIGKKIEELLKNNGFENLTDLANSDEGRLREVLVSAGERYRIHDPSTWPEQSRLADEGKWDELKEYQDFLSGGKLVGK